MKTVQFIFLLALVSAPAWGSNAKVDSLKQLLEHHTTIDKAGVLWGIAYELFDVDNGQALFYAERAYHEVWKRGDSLQIVKVGTTYGQLLRRRGKVDRSIEVSSRMLPIAKRHEYRKYWKMLLNSLGLANMEIAKFDMAIDYNYQSLVLRLEDGDTMEIVTVLQNLGLTYYRLGDYDKSIEFTTRSMKMIESLKPKPNWVSTYLRTGYENLASVYFSQRLYSKANDYFRRAFLIPKDKDYPETYGNLIWAFAESFLGIGSLDSARHYVYQSVEVGLAEGNYYALCHSYLLISRILTLEEKWSQAEAYLQKAEGIEMEYSYPMLHDAILKQRFHLLALQGRGKEVAKALDIYERYCDSLELAKGRSRINSLQVTFAQRENESKLKAQAAIMLMQKENLNRQQIFILVVSVLLILLVVLSLALYRANKRKQEVNQMLDRIVEERTRELSRHRDALQRLIDEENGRRSKASAELVSLLASLKGLLHLTKLDHGKWENDYLDKALELTLQIEGVNHRYGNYVKRKPEIAE